MQPGPLDPPHVPPAPTADEDLSTKPAAQIAFREAYYSGYGPARAVSRSYQRNAQRYRDLYYRLHAEVGGAGHLWKLVRTFDDPATWTEPGVRHLATNGIGGEAYRTDPLDDQWELYDLTVDRFEAVNRWTDPELHELRQHLRMQLKRQRASSVPERNQPWPYANRQPPARTSGNMGSRVLRRFGI